MIWILLIIFSLPAQSETILIKRSGSKNSKAILNKKFVFMKEAPHESFTRSDSSTLNTSDQNRPNNTKTLSSLSSGLQQSKKTIYNSSKQDSPDQNKILTKKREENIYDEDNWDQYAEYKEIELDESLGVHAKIIK